MRYQRKSAVAYVFRNFVSLAYVALPVSVALAFFFNFSAEMNLYKAFVTGKLTVFDFWAHAGESLSVMRFAKCWWQALLTLLLLIVTFSLLTVKIGKHMRVGEMSALPFKRAFRVMPSMALYVFCCFASIQIAMLIPVGIAYLLRSVENLYVVMPICFAMVMIVRVVLAYLFALLIVAFPIRYGENYRFNVALAYSVRITSKKRACVYAFTFGYPLARLVAGILATLASPVPFLEMFIYALFYFAWVMYLPVLAFTLYHGSIGSERRDLNQKIF